MQRDAGYLLKMRMVLSRIFLQKLLQMKMLQKLHNVKILGLLQIS